MKFLFVTRRYPPFAGGAENQIARIASALAKNGHMVRVFTGRYDKSLPVCEEKYGVMVLRLPDPKIRFIGTIVFLLHLAWQMHHRSYYDAVFTNMVNETSTVGILIGKFFHKKTFFRLSGKNNLEKCSPFSLKKLHHKIAFCADGMIAQTEILKKFAISKGYPEKKIKIISNIIPSSCFFDFSLKNNSVLHILWCGRLHPVKNPMLLCEIVEFLKGKIEFVIDVVGHGEEECRLKKAVVEKQSDRFFIFHGFQKNTSVFYQNADIYLLTSDTDAMPNAVLEAMAAAVPVVATNVDGVPILVKDKESALLFEPGNAKQAAEKIIQLAENISLRESLSLNAQQRAQNLFSEKIAVEKYEKLLQNK